MFVISSKAFKEVVKAWGESVGTNELLLSNLQTPIKEKNPL